MGCGCGGNKGRRVNPSRSPVPKRTIRTSNPTTTRKNGRDTFMEELRRRKMEVSRRRK